MNIELDGIPLVKAEQNQTGETVEIRNVSNINTSDNRSMVEHEIPGMEGNVFHNLGRSPVKISFDGSIQGKSAKSNLEIIRSKYKQGIPLPFNANISGATDVTKVLIEDLNIRENAGIIDNYKYSIILREYKEPPPVPTTPPSQDEKAKEWVDETAEDTTESINYITGKVLDDEGSPKGDVTVLITSADGEFNVKTNEEGIYRTDDLPTGKYKVTVDAEGYEGFEEEVIIGKGEGTETEKTKEEPTETENEEEPSETEEEPTEEEEPPEYEEEPTEKDDIGKYIGEITEEEKETTETERTEEEKETTETERTEEEKETTETERTEEEKEND